MRLRFFCGSRALSTGLTSTFFTKNNFKTGFHGIIHIFKNYFPTVFSVFNNKRYLNRPLDSTRRFKISHEILGFVWGSKFKSRAISDCVLEKVEGSLVGRKKVHLSKGGKLHTLKKKGSKLILIKRMFLNLQTYIFFPLYFLFPLALLIVLRITMGFS